MPSFHIPHTACAHGHTKGMERDPILSLFWARLPAGLSQGQGSLFFPPEWSFRAQPAPYPPTWAWQAACQLTAGQWGLSAPHLHEALVRMLSCHLIG